MRWPAATCCYLALLHLATGELGVLESWLADFRVSVPKGTVPPVEADAGAVGSPTCPPPMLHAEQLVIHRDLDHPEMVTSYDQLA
eukprot:Skav217396  [mRNA]  locus=scaffold532:639344:641256:- [translate_table: standard]